jgi:hypothetical protein
MNSFAVGVIVEHKNFIGEVRFVCDDYMSVCTSVGVHRAADICVIVYKKDWGNVNLFKESTK